MENDNYGLAERQAPDFDEDPAGNLDSRARATSSRVEKLEQHITQQQVQQQASQVAELERSFANDHPDYESALEHVRSERLDQLKLTGLNDEQAQAQLGRDEVALIQNHMDNSTNPVEAIYDLAQRSGYKSEAQAKTADPFASQPLPEFDQALADMGFGGK